MRSGTQDFENELENEPNTSAAKKKDLNNLDRYQASTLKDNNLVDGLSFDEGNANS